ncbi:hypothetical protein [Paenibacillus contaminans]|uniref:Uncharacterized protein n=1 Tax=Paenibacillus contaminans TaxID=450362 RepID=A0A329MJS4_9BACL|nr:hypothetical protein [Paenibacillus contaminans]RAV20201.1 hypothetical protein DQG23_17210 [Paenibacillus contaminans]
MLESEIARLQQEVEVRLTLESDFTGLENGFTGVPSKIPAASGRFRTIGGERKPYSIPSGQNRTPAHASEERDELIKRFPASFIELSPPIKGAKSFL